MQGFHPIIIFAYKFLKRNYLITANTLIISFLILLPYLLFKGKFFIGGDDTRLFYIYPKEYLTNTQFFSWTNLSSVGLSFSYQTFLPFVSLWTLLAEIIKSRILLGYLSFSLSLILGLIYFQKLIRELIIENKNGYSFEIVLGSLFFIFSPIIINNHFLNPLIPIWLIGLIPAVCYYFLRFLSTGKYAFVLKSVILTSVFSFGSHNIPWGAGFFLPMSFALILCALLFKKEHILLFVKRLAIFSSIILLSQSFWLLGFFITFINPSTGSLAATIVSKDFTSDFARTVNGTSTGTIIYPLLNLFHRQIAFDYQWNLKNIYSSFYDKTYFLNTIYIIVLFLGIINFRKNMNLWERKTFILLLVAFILSLYFFTVNIGPLKDLFIQFGNIPGFIMFRNAYDKFALGYALIYSLLITYCLVIIRRKFSSASKIYLLLPLIFLLVTIINILPTKRIIVSSLWTTKNIYKNIVIPSEYLDFMNQVKNKVYSTNSIFSIPYGIASYTVIKDVNSNNVYAGVSPVIIFSGVNDISGFLSFNYGPGGIAIDKSILEKNYSNLNDNLYKYNINYIFITRNIPEEVKKSFLFSSENLKAQDSEFLSNITDKKIIKSSEGNYELYTAKKKNSLISSDNLTYKKISRIKYEILIKNIKGEQEFLFNDSFNKGWKLYQKPLSNKFNCENPVRVNDIKTTECKPELSFFEMSELAYGWANPVFEKSHKVQNDFSNKWTIDSEFIKDNFDKNHYRINEDGSVDIELTLYYMSQFYFYFGAAISMLTVGALAAFIILKKK